MLEPKEVDRKVKTVTTKYLKPKTVEIDEVKFAYDFGGVYTQGAWRGYVQGYWINEDKSIRVGRTYSRKDRYWVTLEIKGLNLCIGCRYHSFENAARAGIKCKNDSKVSEAVYLDFLKEEVKDE